MLNKKLYPALAGVLIWLLLILVYWPESPLHLEYVRLILVAAPLTIVPICLKDYGVNPWNVLALALPFGIGMLIPAGAIATLAVIPWLLLAIWLVAKTANTSDFELSLQWLKHITPPTFLLVAACWAFADRTQIRPMGFSPAITLLTAVHFHYAGFALAWLVNRIHGPKWMQFGILSGVALVAIGIMTSQYALPAWIEVASVSLLAGCTLLFAIRIVARGFRHKRWLLVTGGIALGNGMLLALCYGWRFYFLIPALDIPMMYALHGSLNSLGFALPVIWSEASTD